MSAPYPYGGDDDDDDDEEDDDTLTAHDVGAFYR